MKRAKRSTRSVPHGRHATANSTRANGAASSSPATSRDEPSRHGDLEGHKAILLILALTERGAYSADTAVPLSRLCAATQLAAESVERLGRTFSSSYFAIVESLVDIWDSPVSSRKSRGYYIACTADELDRVRKDLVVDAKHLLGRAADLHAAATTIKQCVTPWTGREITQGRRGQPAN